MPKQFFSALICLFLAFGSSLAAGFQTDFRVKINDYSLLYLEPANPFLERDKVMFPLLGLVYVTRGFQWFETYTTAPPADIRKREFIAPTDFDRFVQVDAVNSRVTIRVLNAVNEPAFVFVNGQSSVQIRINGSVTTRALSVPARALEGNPRRMFVALSDLAKLFGFALRWDAASRTAQIVQPRWMRHVAEEMLSKLSPTQILTSMFPVGFTLNASSNSMKARVVMKSQGENLDVYSAGVYLFAEAYSTTPGYTAINLIGPKFERRVAGRDPPNPYPNPCRISLAKLDCTYTSPLEPDLQVKYVLGVAVRLY